MENRLTILKSMQVVIFLPAYFANAQRTQFYKVMDKDHYFEICLWGHGTQFKRSNGVGVITSAEICSQMEQIEKPEFFKGVQEAVKRNDGILDDLMADENLPTIDMALNNLINNSKNHHDEN